MAAKAMRDRTEHVAPSDDSGLIDLSSLQLSRDGSRERADSGVDTIAPVVNHPPFSRLMAQLRLKRMASLLVALAVVAGLMTLDSGFDLWRWMESRRHEVGARTPHLMAHAMPKNDPPVTPPSTPVDSDTPVPAPDLATSPSDVVAEPNLVLAPPARVQSAKPDVGASPKPVAKVATKPVDATGLAGAIEKAVGPLDAVRSVADETPATPGPRGDIPEALPQGAIQGALGTQRQATRACLEGQTAPSRATVVFASAGHVESVTIAGPATGSPAEACIRTALSKIAVGPFRRARFAVTTTITPP